MDKSSLFIERLIIIKSHQSVYDESFHRGINVIRGDHSVGKTTILEMLFYVLGGEIKENQWLFPADRCDEIFCQLNINGKTFTIKRAIEKDTIPPISVRSGVYDQTENNTESWKTYGPRRNDANDKMSFSQQLFELLGWDSHKSEDYANLTMHQVLRFLYVDQETASTKLLRAEDNVRGDSEGIRTAIFEFLLGLDNLDTHELRQKLLIAEREFDKVAADLSAMYRVLGGDSILTLEILENNIVSNLEEITRLRDTPIEVEPEADLSNERENKYRSIEKKIKQINRRVQTFRQELLSVNGEIVDCELFEKSLQFRKKSLLESQKSYDAIGLVKYERCPCCLKELEESDEDSCPLCKSPKEDQKHHNNYMEILTELDFQINSNAKMLEEYRVRHMDLYSAIKISEAELYEAQSEQDAVAKMVDISTELALENSKKIGYLESENDNLNKKIEIVKELEKNKKTKKALNEIITDLKDKIEAAKASNKSRREEVYSGICENMVSMLHKDKRKNEKPYEEVFLKSTASDIEIDFAKDRTLIDGRVKFSGSSNYIKKNSFHLSALLESLDDKSYRLPRFLMLDAIENGGMKEFRSHNFQKSIIENFKDRDDFQIIFCTSMVLDELNNDSYGVGPFYEGNVIDI